MLVSGGRGVGKTEFTKIVPPSKRIVWCYANHQQDLFEDLVKMNVEYVEGILGELDKYFKKSKRTLIILDDLMNETTNSFKITQLFTRGSHDNLSVIYLRQNLFPKIQHALSLNSDYMVIFKKPRNNSQFATIARIVEYVRIK